MVKTPRAKRLRTKAVIGFVGLLLPVSLRAQSPLDSGPWPTLGHDNQRTNQSSLQGPISPGTPTVLYDAGSSIGINQVVVTSDGKILLTACVGRVIALNSSGQSFGPLWPFPLMKTAYAGSPETAWGITVSNSGTIYVASHECPDISGAIPVHFYSIRSNGANTPNWPIATSAMYWPAAIGSNGMIYQMDELQRIHAYSSSGTSLWTVGLPSYGQGEIALDAAGNLYVGTDANLSGGHAIYSFTPSGASRTGWPNDTGGVTAPTTPAITPGGAIYIANVNGSLYSFNSDGSSRAGFPFSSGGAVSQQPLAVSSSGIVYMKTSAGLFAINPNGTLVWSAPFAPGGDASLSPGPVVDADGYIYVAFGNSVYSLNPDGTLRSGWPTTIPNAGPLIIGGNGLLYVVSGGQKVYTVTESSGNSPLTVLNPFAPYPTLQQAPPTLTMPEVLSSPSANSLAADGESAVVLAYQSRSSQPVTFHFSASGVGIAPGCCGSLGDYDPDYLGSPNPVTGGVQMYTVNTPHGPDAAGNYTFLALLWAPAVMPVPNASPAVIGLDVTATQTGGPTGHAFISLEPPPLLLVHGIWASAAESWFSSSPPGGFFNWISNLYPPNLVYMVDYNDPTFTPNLNSQSFDTPAIQHRLLMTMTNALSRVAALGMAARTVDVVAHSEGGLVTRYFMSPVGATVRAGNPALLPNPVHKLITIGTPHLGTQLATALELHLSATPPSHSLESAVCAANNVVCTLTNFFRAIGRTVDTGVLSFVPSTYPLNALDPQNHFGAIVGLAPHILLVPSSATELFLNQVILDFLPGLQSVGTILGTTLHDTIVPASSQNPSSPGQTDSATVSGIVHANLCLLPVISLVCPDIGETASPDVWAQAYYWLSGGTGTAPVAGVSSNASARALTSAATAPLPVLDLTGYTQVAASNVALLPASGAVLTINSATNITASSSTKTITELLLLQTVMDPTDAVLLYATQSPFTISYMPTRLGSASFVAIALFSDKTYAMTTLNYTLQPSGTPYDLNLVNAPVANMTVGTSDVIQANALFISGPINVTQVATYTARSGSASVFSVSTGGTITANGNGVDLLDVSYGGVTATAPIVVGACTYALNPSIQLVPNTGGTVTIQVATQPGCAWTASGGAAWLSFTQASGSGSGAITLTAAANGSGGTQAALVTLASLTAVIVQPTTACSYGLSQTQISAPAAGASGTITVTTSCPVIASSNQSWVTATPLGSSVTYSVAPNDGASPRSATLTIGTQPVSVSQSGSATVLAPDLSSPLNGAQGVSLTASLYWDAAVGATSYDVYFGTPSSPPFVVNTTATSFSPGTLAETTTYYWYVVARNGSATASSSTWSFTTLGPGVALQFYPITPCRIADTRAGQNFTGAFGPPSLAAFSDRNFPLLSGGCSIPSTAQAYSLNFTAVPDGPLGFLSAWPDGDAYPGVSTLNSTDGSVIANAAIVPAGTGGGITVVAGDPTDLIIDVNGYFAPAAAAGLDFFPLTPCRIADTRSTQNFTGAFGPPSLGGFATRDFPLATSPCLSGSEFAYSLNVTAVPPGPLGFLSIWPAGQPYPGVSTLNSPDGTTLANAAIVPSGTGGDIDVVAGNPTDLILDINGKFAAPGAGGLQFYTVTPCRVADTRSSQNFTGQFGPPSLAAFVDRNFPIQSSPCGIPATVQAYALNMTVVPPGPLSFLSAWPAGQAYPGVSTLNSTDGLVIANAAIVPAGTGGAITVVAGNPTDLIIDIVGYFAP